MPSNHRIISTDYPVKKAEDSDGPFHVGKYEPLGAIDADALLKAAAAHPQMLAISFPVPTKEGGTHFDLESDGVLRAYDMTTHELANHPRLGEIGFMWKGESLDPAWDFFREFFGEPARTGQQFGVRTNCKPVTRSRSLERIKADLRERLEHYSKESPVPFPDLSCSTAEHVRLGLEAIKQDDQRCEARAADPLEAFRNFPGDASDLYTHGAMMGLAFSYFLLEDRLNEETDEWVDGEDMAMFLSERFDIG